MSLTSLLPSPRHTTATSTISRASDSSILNDNDNDGEQRKTKTVNSTARPYGQRKGWVPRSQSDFGDGGAFPEVHVAQYPLGMGKKRNSNALPVKLDANGNVKYEAVLGHNNKQIVHANVNAILTKDASHRPALPDADEVAKTTEETKAVLLSIAAAKTTAKAVKAIGDSEYIRYTPADQSVEHNSGSTQRVIRVTELTRDPMEPARFELKKKLDERPPSPPAPVMHSPPRKASKEAKQNWIIPPCISRWNNQHGHIIALDKRLATDARGLQVNEISDNFAKLAESLYIADKKVRESIALRKDIEKKSAQRKREKLEDNLRLEAQKAREARSGITVPSVSGLEGEAGATAAKAGAYAAPYNNDSSSADEADSRDHERSKADHEDNARQRSRSHADESSSHASRRGDDEGDRHHRHHQASSSSSARHHHSHSHHHEDRDRSDEDQDRRRQSASGRGAEADPSERERDAIREQRRREREHERRLAKVKGREGERERDISEQIALGGAATNRVRTEESLYDSRLFNQSAGMQSGFGDDEGYSVYDKPLFSAQNAAQTIYRPRKDAESEIYDDADVEALIKKSSEKFQSGADPVARRDGPVQFSKGETTATSSSDSVSKSKARPESSSTSSQAVDDDLFGLNKFLTEAKKGKQAMEKIGKSGTLHAGTTGGGVSEITSSRRDRSIAFEGEREHDDRGKRSRR